MSALSPTGSAERGAQRAGPLVVFGPRATRGLVRVCKAPQIGWQPGTPPLPSKGSPGSSQLPSDRTGKKGAWADGMASPSMARANLGTTRPMRYAVAITGPISSRPSRRLARIFHHETMLPIQNSTPGPAATRRARRNRVHGLTLALPFLIAGGTRFHAGHPTKGMPLICGSCPDTSVRQGPIRGRSACQRHPKTGMPTTSRQQLRNKKSDGDAARAKLLLSFALASAAIRD